MASTKELHIRMAQGNNQLSAFSLYQEKNYYNDKIFPEKGWTWFEKPIDFNANPLYGKINLKKEPIFPNTNQLKNITEEVKVFDFVADAFLDLQNYINKHILSQWLTKEGIIAEFKPKKGYIDVEKYLIAQSESHYFVFVSSYLKNQAKKGNQVRNFFDFMKHFINYSKISLKISPFTNTAIHTSMIISPLSTGLCIEIHDHRYDDDSEKHRFIQDPNYNFYKIAARKHGFMLDRNVPWRLVADVSSFKMREYMRLASENKVIKLKEAQLLQNLESELKAAGGFPKMPTLEQIMNMSEKEIADSTWNFDTIENKRNEVNAQLEQIKEEVKNMFADHWEIQQLVNAVDPEVDSSGNYICEGKKCSSRITKFDSFFDNYYYLVIDSFGPLQSRFYQYYKSYIIQNPTLTIQEGNCFKEIDREDILLENYNLKYGKEYWFKVYIELRMAEANMPLSIKERNKHLKRMIEISKLHKRVVSQSDSEYLHRKKLDFLQSIRYIDSLIMNKFNDAAGVYHSLEVQKAIAFFVSNYLSVGNI